VGWFTSRNVAHARVLGSEVEWVYEAGDGVSGGVEYTYTDSRDLEYSWRYPTHRVPAKGAVGSSTTTSAKKQGRWKLRYGLR